MNLAKYAFTVALLVTFSFLAQKSNADTPEKKITRPNQNWIISIWDCAREHQRSGNDSVARTTYAALATNAPNSDALSTLLQDCIEGDFSTRPSASWVNDFSARAMEINGDQFKPERFGEGARGLIRTVPSTIIVRGKATVGQIVDSRLGALELVWAPVKHATLGATEVYSGLMESMTSMGAGARDLVIEKASELRTPFLKKSQEEQTYERILGEIHRSRGEAMGFEDGMKIDLKKLGAKRIFTTQFVPLHQFPETFDAYHFSGLNIVEISQDDGFSPVMPKDLTDEGQIQVLVEGFGKKFTRIVVPPQAVIVE